MAELIRAAWAGNVAWVKTLLREGVQVNSRDSWGRTALHYACRTLYEDMQRVVDVLLDAGADVNAQEGDGQTPLHIAVRRISFPKKIENNAAGGENKESHFAISSNRNEVLVKTLLREGVQVNSRDISGRTALHYACESEDEDMQRVVDVLLDAGAEVNAQDEDGQTPLHIAVRRISFQTKIENNAAGGENETPLAISSKRNEVLVKTLLREGAQVDVRDRKMRTILHWACTYQQGVIEDELREACDLTNLQDETGKTRLHVAIVNNEIVKALLANITSESSKERSSQHLVDHSQDKEKVRMVNSQDGDGNTALHLTCTRSSLTDDIMECVCLLFCAGAKVGVKNNTGETALHMAASYSRANVVDILLNNGEDVNATDKLGNTPLHVASESGRTEIVRLLLSKGAKVGVKNAMRKTPLHKAAALAAGDTVHVLVDHGEYVRAKDHFGNTPLHQVGAKARFKCINDREIVFIINFLIIRGAKIDEQNIQGETPHEQIKARRDNRMKDVETTLITQVIRLKKLGLQDKFDINWIFGPDFYDNVKIRCCQELESMKSTIVVKDISLYQVLSHINQPFLVSTEDLKHIDELLSSPDLLTRFPLYGDTLRITFQRAKLLTLAVQSFYSEQRKQMMKKLPCKVTEQLVNFLSNNDLRMFIESE